MPENTNIGSNQYVIFSIGKQKFGIDVMDSREIIKTKNLTTLPEAPSFVEGVINLREQIIPIINLSKKFNLNKNIKDNNKVIIIAVEDELIGLMVKDVEEINSLNTEDINQAPEITRDIDQNYIKGIATLREELIIILDTNKILKNSEVEEIEGLDINR